MESHYKSPTHKLVSFFENSRDQWRDKTKTSKADIKNLKKKLQYAHETKSDLKMKNKGLKEEISTLKNKMVELEKQLEDEQKKNVNAPSEPFVERIPRHSYSAGHIALLLKFVFTSVSLRCSQRVLNTVFDFLNIKHAVPTWYTVRLWLLKLGYYKLHRTKEIADDWIWIPDHSVQIGKEKCLVILGIRAKDLPKDRALTYEDVEPILVAPLQESNGAIVFDQLLETVDKTGLPLYIVSDAGPDLKTGIDLFCEYTKHTQHIYDITHLIANLLKKMFEPNEIWQSFTRYATTAQSYMRQTSVAALAPPNQRSKARYMNIDILIKWAAKTLDFIDSPECAEMFDQEFVNSKLAWLRYFKDDIAEWSRIINVASIVGGYIKNNGIHSKMYSELHAELIIADLCPAALDLAIVLMKHVAKLQALPSSVDQRLLGTSDIIESLFGRFKNMEQQQSGSGFTQLILGLPALVANTTTETIKNAMETVKIKDIKNWAKSCLGDSVQKQRMVILGDLANRNNWA